MSQAVEMERQCVRRDPERHGNAPAGHPVRSRLHQQAEHVETVVLRESR